MYYEAKTERALLDFYTDAREFVVKNGFANEVRWQQSIEFAVITETDLLQQAAWVILCSGFKESIVRRVFDYISLCFCDWESSNEILDKAALCVSSASAAFNNMKKLWALVDVASHVNSRGFEMLMLDISREPIATLQELPYIGPVTAWHLAKNIGINLAKPDRHLMKISAEFGYGDPNALCQYIAEHTGDEVRIVDIVLWRFAAEHGGNISFRPEGRSKGNRLDERSLSSVHAWAEG